MHYYLCTHPEETGTDLAKRLECTFGFVGLQNLYGLSHQIFFTANEADSLQPTTRLNIASDELDYAASVSHLKSAIEAANSKDMKIYLHFEALYKSNQDKFWKVLAKYTS